MMATPALPLLQDCDGRPWQRKVKPLRLRFSEPVRQVSWIAAAYTLPVFIERMDSSNLESDLNPWTFAERKLSLVGLVRGVGVDILYKFVIFVLYLRAIMFYKQVYS